MKAIPILLLSSLLFLCQCKTKKATISSEPAIVVPIANDHQVILLDSTQASLAITTDEKDHFFERVTLTEVSIQMKKELDCNERSICIKDYKNYLKGDVENFSEEEVNIVSEIFVEVNELITKVNPLLIDRDIILIKTKGNHYGDGTFYTRENKIIIPADVLVNINKQRFKETMLHEIFHIFSRYNEDTRNQLYDLIGFKPIKSEIAYGDIGTRKLLNPDGTTDYYIELDEHGPAYPLITANEDGFTASKPTFFNYLDFHLYKLEDDDGKTVKVGDQLQFEDTPSFFSQIKDNTNYIIHPDEIMADNFIYTIYYVAKDEKLKKFSDEGMALIDNFAKILKAHQ